MKFITPQEFGTALRDDEADAYFDQFIRWIGWSKVKARNEAFQRQMRENPFLTDVLGERYFLRSIVFMRGEMEVFRRQSPIIGAPTVSQSSAPVYQFDNSSCTYSGDLPFNLQAGT